MFFPTIRFDGSLLLGDSRDDLTFSSDTVVFRTFTVIMSTVIVITIIISRHMRGNFGV